ncbi:hypothetical protein PGB90_001854 [Kerria lacca]
MDEIKHLNLYALLDVSPSADVKVIKTAYRKKALTCHPDKNPDDPEAVKQFHLLSKVLTVLLDEPARASYDRVLKAREANKLRNQALDSQRKKLKRELEEKELLAEQEYLKKSAEELLQREIERLRKQSSKEVEEEAERVRQLIAERANERLFSLRRIQIRWRADKNDETNGGYNEKNLTELFSKYGEVEALVISSKKKGSALVEFSSVEAAKKAQYQEIGYDFNPLKIKILGNENRQSEPPIFVKKTESFHNKPSFPCFPSLQLKSDNAQNITDLNNFESIVLKGLQEAQAKKDLMKNSADNQNM